MELILFKSSWQVWACCAFSLHGASGQVGDLLTFIQRHALRYAKSVLNNPEKLALYKQYAEPGVTPFNLATRDFISVPKIELIDTSNYAGAVGNIIAVVATDDTMVTDVRVRIASAAGVKLEEGLAELNPEMQTFDYAATAANGVLAGTQVTAFAKDLPGNVTEVEKVL